MKYLGNNLYDESIATMKDITDGGSSGGDQVDINDQTPTYTVSSSLANLVSGEKISIAFGKIAKAIESLISHLSDTNNPHNVNASQVGAAVTNHASTATTYGTGTSTKYGHLKLSDSTSSTSGTSDGVAATPAAVKSVMDAVSAITTPSPSDASPIVDGTAAAGSSSSYSRGDHVHPTDTSRAPTDHAVTATTYGKGTATNYGHLKLSDSTSSTSGESGGIAATPAAVKAVMDAVEAATGGAVPSDTNPLMNGTAAAGSSAYYSRGDHVHPTDTSRAPTDHSNTSNTYGTGTSTKYGHLKLSNSTSSTSGTSDGVAATPAAVKAVMDAIPSVPSAYASNPAMNGTASAGSSTSYSKGDHVHPTDTSRAPTDHSATATTYGIGTDTKYGHVKLSDSTTSTSSTSGGIAATPAAVKAVKDACAASSHTHSAADITSGTLPISRGGTGGTTAATARHELGVVRPAKFVIGTSTAGWTTGDCDYLCDGTDDQVEINAAITACGSSGGKILFLDGTYNITDNISINKENIEITGTQWAEIHFASGKKFDVTASECSFNNLTISSDGLFNHDISYGIIDILGQSSAYLSNIVISNLVLKSAFVRSMLCNNITISNITTGSGFAKLNLMLGSNVSVSNCHLSKMQFGNMSNINIVNNIISNFKDTSYIDGITITNCKDVLIDSNLIKFEDQTGSNAGGLVYITGSSSSISSGVVVSNNILDGSSMTQSNGIYINHTKDLIINSNIISSNGTTSGYDYPIIFLIPAGSQIVNDVAIVTSNILKTPQSEGIWTGANPGATVTNLTQANNVKLTPSS